MDVVTEDNKTHIKIQKTNMHRVRNLRYFKKSYKVYDMCTNPTWMLK